MGVFRRKDGRWHVSYRDLTGKSRSKTFAKGRHGKKDAQEFFAEICLRKARGEELPLSRAEGVYLDDLAQLWLDEKRAQGRARQWLKDWAHILNTYFLPVLARRPAHMLTQADVLAVISSHYADRAQSTRNRYIGYIKSILQFGVEHGHLKANPLARWKPGKETRRQSPLDLDGLRKLQKHAPPHLAWAREVAWNIPVRPGAQDLFALRFEAVDYGREGVSVFHSKVGRWAFIPLPAPFLRALYARERQHKSGHLVEYRGRQVKRMDTALDTAAKRARLAYPVCMYDVRHLWITTALDQGVPPSVVASMAGTSVDMIVSNYYEDRAAAQQCVEAMPTLGTDADKGSVISICGAIRGANGKSGA